MKKIFLVLAILIVSMNFACAETFESEFDTLYAYSSAKAPNLQIKQMKYEPYPVNPSEYVRVWIKVENLGTGLTKDATFKIIPKFPFSFDDPKDSIKSYGQIGYGRNEEDNLVVLEYKVKVDKDAIEGTNEIELKYNTDGSDSWFYKKFDIEITDAQTDFDLVIQEVSEQQVSVAIANTGKNIAYSVIVKIPEQENFETIGTEGQMVGNLENGDYTLVSFELNEKTRTSGKKPLRIQIDYTDNIGERRSVIKEIMFEMDSTANQFPGMTNSEDGTMPEGFPANRMGQFGRQMITQEKEIYQEWWFWVITLGVFFIGWKVTKKIKEKKNKK